MNPSGTHGSSQSIPSLLRSPLFLPVVLFAGVLILYIPALDSSFVNYDDSAYVTANRHVLQGLSWSNVGWAFRATTEANWHPLTWLSHMADVQLFGAESSRPPSHQRASARIQCSFAVLHSSPSNGMPDPQRGSGGIVCFPSIERRVRRLGRGAEVRAFDVLLASGVGGVRVVRAERGASAVIRLWLRSSRSGSPPSRWS